MNPLFFVALMAAGAAANAYGSHPAAVRVEQASYAQPQRLAYAQPHSYGSSNQGSQIPILRFNQEIRGGQSDNVEFETGNGIRSTFHTQVVPGRGGGYMNENGQMVQSDSSLEQSGHSYHQAPDGRHIALTWTANENGFHATGDHLPQPVPMPAEHAEAHRQALAVAAANPPQREDLYSSNSYSAPAPALVRVQSYGSPAIRSGY